MSEAGLRWTCLTASGEGGLTVFRIAGPRVGELIKRIFRCHTRESQEELRVGHLLDAGHLLDEVVVHVDGRLEAAEISTHGGPSTRQAMKELLGREGVCQVAPERLLPRAEAGGHRLALETLRGLQAAWSLEGMLFFLDPARGHLTTHAELLAAGLSSCSPADSERVAVLRQELESLLARAAFGRAFAEPPSIALVGLPNAGKSTLFNHLLGHERCIVTADPGTTRDVVRAPVVLRGCPFQLADTAGLAERARGVEAAGVQRALATLQSADLVVLVIDGHQPFDPACLPASLLGREGLVIAVNKCDLPAVLVTQEVQARLRRPVCEIAARQGVGLDALADLLVFRSAFRGPATRSMVVPFTSRQQICLERALESLELAPTRAAAHLLDLIHGGPQALAVAPPMAPETCS